MLAYSGIGSSAPTACSVAMDVAAVPSLRVSTSALHLMADINLAHVLVKVQVKVKKKKDLGIGRSAPTACSVSTDVAAVLSLRVSTSALHLMADIYLALVLVKVTKRQVLGIGYSATPACSVPTDVAAAPTRRVSSSALHLLVGI